MPKPRASRLLLLLLVLLVAGAAAAWPNRWAAFDRWIAPLLDKPFYVARDCTTTPPEGIGIACGALYVPRARTGGDRGAVVLPVVRYGAGTDPAPVLLLQGAHGRRQIAAEKIKPDRFAWRGDHDLIQIDPRGTGGAWPALRCPALRESLLGRPANGEHALGTVSHHELAERIESCRAALRRDGIDPADFNLAEAAADLADLRRALGLAGWHVVARGAATRLALALMREDGEALRGVVLEAVHPPHVDHTTAAARARFASIPGCINGLGENWLTMSEKTWRRLRDTPERVEWTDIFLFKRTFAVTLGADLFAELARTALTRMDDKTYVCEILVKAAAGNYRELLAPFLLWYRDSSDLSFGAMLSQACGEDLTTETGAAPGSLLEALAWPRLRRHCALWPRRPADPSRLAPVRSRVPVLLLADSFDAGAPAIWAEHQAALLPRAHLIVLAAGQRGRAAKTRCMPEIVAAFLENPARRPAPACLNP